MNYTPIIEEAGRGLGEALAPFWFLVLPAFWAAYVAKGAGIDDDAFSLFLAFALILFLVSCSLVMQWRKPAPQAHNDPLFWFNRLPWAFMRLWTVLVILWFVMAAKEGYPLLLKGYLALFFKQPSQFLVADLQAFWVPTALWVVLAASSAYEVPTCWIYAKSPRSAGGIINPLLFIGFALTGPYLYRDFILPNLLPFFGKSYAPALYFFFVQWFFACVFFAGFSRLAWVLPGKIRAAKERAREHIADADEVKTWGAENAAEGGRPRYNAGDEVKSWGME